ncbi:MAG TPA: hypothetical protein VJ396_07620, partial [Acidiferrobacterales bacterium]|nr:hypothetical protein [Acidiferrobacterales bacterium]
AHRDANAAARGGYACGYREKASLEMHACAEATPADYRYPERLAKARTGEESTLTLAIWNIGNNPKIGFSRGAWLPIILSKRSRNARGSGPATSRSIAGRTVLY